MEDQNLRNDIDCNQRLDLLARQRAREKRLEEEFPDYDPEHGRKTRELGMVHGNMMGSFGAGV